MTNRAVSVLAATTVGAAAGGLVVLAPAALAALIAVACLLVLAIVGRDRLPSLCVALAGGCCTGYVLLGRGFSYIAVGPAYIGELLLGTCLVGAALAPARRGAFGLVTVRLYAAFALWGAVLLARGDSLGRAALRDSALWYYGLFMVAGGVLFASRGRIVLVLRWAARVLPWVMVWIPVAYAMQQWMPDRIPLVPGTDVPLLVFKGGDLAVMLAVAIVFFLACRRADERALQQAWPVWLLWTIAVVDFLVIASNNRGGMACIVAAVLVTCVLAPNLRIMQGIGIAAAIGAVLLLANVAVRVDGRDVSVAQVGMNALSIVDQNAGHGDSLDGTAGWRLAFWRDIIDDTVYGDRFWTGNGFGINLADEYGYQVASDGSLRSPHNVAMTVLARMGVPGLALWLAIQLSYAFTMLVSFLEARRMRDRMWAAMFLLLLAHWVASLVDASFDPYLEGPQGAIVFWTGLGVGIAARRAFVARAARPLAPVELPELSPHAVRRVTA